MKTALLLVGVLGLAFCSVGSVQAQEVTGTTKSPSDQSVTVYLDYRELNYSFINWGLTLVAKSPAFKKEPVFGGGKVIRGTLQLGGSKSDEMGFAWDRAAGKLYLDLNRNLDLTDDAAGVFSCGKGFNDNFQFFTSVRLPFKTPAGSRPMLADLSFNDYGRLSCSAAMRSLWQGKVTLQGAEWGWACWRIRSMSEHRWRAAACCYGPGATETIRSAFTAARWTLFRFRVTCF